MASKLKLKRKKFHEPYKDLPKEGNMGGIQHIKTETNKIKLVKNNRIFERAIANAAKHRIGLRPGTENNGGGNCSYESVILNINKRDCYEEKLHMSADYYRRIWNTDLLNKILDERIPWNPGLTRAQMIAGFQELMESGVYERSFFGDMMIAGIACGVRKLILIFNTHEMTPHDPVSVIDPRHYGGICDTEIPVVLAYDLVHYESMEPISLQDIEGTIKLTKSYIATPSRYMEEYGFTRKDMKYLILPSVEHLIEEDISKTQREEYSDAGLGGSKKFPQQNQDSSLKIKKHPETSSKNKTDTTENEYVGMPETMNRTSFKCLNLDFPEMENGNIKCAICKVECARLISHLNHSSKCSQFIDMEKLKMEFTKYRATQRRKKHVEKQKATNPEEFRKTTNERKFKQEA